MQICFNCKKNVLDRCTLNIKKNHVKIQNAIMSKPQDGIIVK